MEKLIACWSYMALNRFAWFIAVIWKGSDRLRVVDDIDRYPGESRRVLDVLPCTVSCFCRGIATARVAPGSITVKS